MFYFIYLFSFGVTLFCGFNFVKYVERSHARERFRSIGITLHNKLNTVAYSYICEYILQELLTLSDVCSGFIEGLLGIDPLVDLYIPDPPKEIIKREFIDKVIFKDVIKEKLIENVVTKLEYVYNEEKIISELRELLNPKIKLLQYENTNDVFKFDSDTIANLSANLSTNMSANLSDGTLLDRIENIFLPKSEQPKHKVKITVGKGKKSEKLSESNRFYEESDISVKK